MSGDIIVGYDGSDGARAALHEAIKLGRGPGFGVAMVFCYEPPTVLAGGVAGDQRDAVKAIGTERLNQGLELAVASGFEVRAELVDARPVEGLVAAAEEHDAPMIVVGHHGEGPLRGARLSATANRLVHQAERPVLVVPATEQVSRPIAHAPRLGHAR